MKLIKGWFFALLGLCVLSLSAVAQNKNGGILLNIGLGLNSQYSGGVPVSGIIEFGVKKRHNFWRRS